MRSRRQAVSFTACTAKASRKRCVTPCTFPVSGLTSGLRQPAGHMVTTATSSVYAKIASAIAQDHAAVDVSRNMVRCSVGGSVLNLRCSSSFLPLSTFCHIWGRRHAPFLGWRRTSTPASAVSSGAGGCSALAKSICFLDAEGFADAAGEVAARRSSYRSPRFPSVDVLGPM